MDMYLFLVLARECHFVELGTLERLVGRRILAKKFIIFLETISCA